MMEFDLSTCVEKEQEMDPETEVLLPGDYLRNGMRVLTDSVNRVHSTGVTPVHASLAHMLRIRNRWCVVTHLTYYDKDLTFIGVYDDHIQEHRMLDRSYSWVVKKNSIRKPIWQRFLNWWNTKKPLFKD